MSKSFDHTKKKVAEALNIDEKSSAEIHGILNSIVESAKDMTTSQKIEGVLNEGFSYVELAYAAYMLGSMDTIHKGKAAFDAVEKDPLSVLGSILGGPFKSTPFGSIRDDKQQKKPAVKKKPSKKPNK